MHWLTVAFAMSAAACLTLAAVHLLVWSRKPPRRAHLAFAMTALSFAALAPIELWMVRAQTPAEFGSTIRGVHLPGTLAGVSLVWFLWLHFGTGRLWLACAAVPWCQERHIPVRAYSPIHQGRLLRSATVRAVAARRNATPAQVRTRVGPQTGGPSHHPQRQ